MEEVVEEGVGGVVFRRLVVKVPVANPFEGFKWEERLVEYRRDPLLDRWARVCASRARRPKHIPETPVSSQSPSGRPCYFCPSQVRTHTPVFPPEIARGGRIEVGGCVLFPNLFPFAPYHAVGTLTPHHDASLNAITGQDVADCLLACREFFERVLAHDPGARYMLVGLNFLHPAGASIAHPHVHAVQDYRPSNLLAWIVRASRAYLNRWGSCFWDDLVGSEEKLEKRLILRGRTSTWLSSFAPLANGELLGVVKGASCFLDLDEGELRSLANDIASVFSLVSRALGAESINIVLLGGPAGEELDHLRVHIRLAIRARPRPSYVSDVGFMELLCAEPVITMVPEDVARELRKSYKNT